MPQSGNKRGNPEMMEDLEVSSHLEFHGVAYVATVSVAQQQLHVQVEVDDSLTSTYTSSSTAASSSVLPPSPRPAATHEWTCWTGSFPSAYIEELTRKTGNFKRFPIFVNMLLSAISQRSDAVFVDLLTTSDLELYRKRKMGSKPSFPQKPNDAFDSFPSATTASTANKRYLILTYAVEFDRVHYPLPLSLVQTPTPEILQRTIRRLRQALSVSKGDSRTQQLHEELESLKEENRCLKNTLKQQFGSPTENVDYSNQQIDGSASPIDLQRELKVATLKENKELIGIYQQLREESSVEISKLKAEIRQLRLSHANDANHHKSDTEDDAIRLLQRQLEQERNESQWKMNDSSNILQETLNQLKLMKAQFDETQLKNRELLRQLAIARAKAGMNHTSPSSARPIQARAGRSTALGTSRTTPLSSAAPSRPATRQRSALPVHFRQPSHLHGESDDDEDGHTTDGDDVSNHRQQQQQSQRPFRRFDPTAYQQEKQRKLRMARSQSPHNSAGATANGRPRRGSNTGGGYTSDSSAGGGYSSAASNDSNQSSRRGRSRTRLSVEHQRAVAERLSSPKRVQDPDSFQHSTPRFRAPLLRPAAAARTSNSRGRSPLPAAATSSTQRRSYAARGSQQPQSAKVLPPIHPRFGQYQRQAMAPPPPPPPPPVQTKRSTIANKKRTQQQQQRNTTGKSSPTAAHASALLADTTTDSFSDIDDRLNALQQFLKEAKQGSTGATVSNKQA